MTVYALLGNIFQKSKVKHSYAPIIEYGQLDVVLNFLTQERKKGYKSNVLNLLKRVKIS